MFMYVLVTQL